MTTSESHILWICQANGTDLKHETNFATISRLGKIFHLEIVVETRGRGNTGSTGATGAVGSAFCMFVICGIDLTALS